MTQTPGPAARAAIAEIATRNLGSITGTELRALGVTHRQIDHLVASGFLHRVRRDHFLVGHRAPSVRGMRMSMVRRAGPGAHLASLAAIDDWGFLPWTTKAIDIVVPRARRPVHGARLRLRPALIDLGGTEHDGLPILEPEFAVLTACQHVDASSIRRIIREGRHRKRISIERLEYVAGLPLHGTPALDAALRSWKQGDNGHGSGFELAVDASLAPDVLEGSLANPEIKVGTESLYPDRAWIGLGILLECDGPPHDEPDQARLDRVRRAAFTADGWDMHVVHWRAFERDPVRAVAALQRAVRNARSLP